MRLKLLVLAVAAWTVACIARVADGSVMLSTAAEIMWERSYHRQPSPAAYADRWLYSHGYVATDQGTITIVYFDSDHGLDRPFDYGRRGRWGFELDRWQGGSSWNRDCQYTSIEVPFWATHAALAALPILP